MWKQVEIMAITVVYGINGWWMVANDYVRR